MERLRDWLRWVILGTYCSSWNFFAGPQLGVIDTYESSLRTLVRGLFGCTDGQAAGHAYTEQLDALRGSPPRERFQGLLEIDSNITSLIPDDILIARRWMFIDRFRRLASPRAYLAFEASLPAATDADRSKKISDLRPDLINLTNYIQQTYILNLERERSLASIKWWLLTRSACFVVLVAVIFALAATPPVWQKPLNWLSVAPSAHAFALVTLAGMLGAVTSISRKFQDLARNNVLDGDPFNEVVSLNAGRPSIAISIGAGGIFALVLYAVVANGPLQGFDWGNGLLPSTGGATTYELGCVESANSCTIENAKPIRLAIHQENLPKTVKMLSKQGLGFSQSGDLIRMLLLAFLAGFAERLVPDSIDRLIKREKSAGGT